MNRIEPDGYFSPRARSDRKKGAGVERGIFSSLLSRPRDSDGDAIQPSDGYRYSRADDEPVEILLDTVHELGEQLKKDPRRQTLVQYKEAVKRLLGYVIDNAIELQEHASGHNIMRRKRFSLIAVIDARLERLGAGVLQAQRDQIEILRRVDEINGLLVDLLR